MATQLNMTLLLRRGVFSDGYVLQAGEPGYHTGTKVLKIGDGSTPWSELGFANQTQIEALIKAVDDKVAALGDTYATDEEVRIIKEALEAAIEAVDGKFANYTTTTAQNAIDAEQDRRLGVIEGDYLKAADIADFETKENVKKVSDDLAAYQTSNNETLAGVKATAEAAATKEYTDAELAKKVDKVEGKSLIDDAEIARLASVNNYNDTEVRGLITDNANAISTEKQRAEGIEGGLRTDINTVMGDYLKAADKTELANAVSALAGEGNDTTVKAVSDRVSAVEGKLADVSNVMDFVGAVDAKPTDVSGYQKGDVIVVTDGDDAGKEFVFDGEEFVEFGYADGNTAAIGALKDRMDAVEAKNGEQDTAIGTKLDASTFTAYETAHAGDYTNEAIDNAITTAKSGAETTAANALASAKTELEGKITAAETAAKQHATDLDTAMAARVKKLEDNDAGYATKTEVGTAKQEAIDAAAADATTKADAARDAAKGYVDTELSDFNTETVAPIAARVKAIEDAPYATTGNVATAKQEAIDAAKAYADGKAHKDTTYTVAATENALEFTVTPSEGDAQTVKLVAPTVDVGVTQVVAGTDIVVTPEAGTGVVTVAHKAYETGTVKDAAHDSATDPSFITGIEIENGHVTGAKVRNLADVLTAMEFILDCGAAE